jgi:hypothetical protein
MVGARDLGLGLGVLLALDRGAPVRGWLEASAVVDGIDAGACLLARRGDRRRRAGRPHRRCICGVGRASDAGVRTARAGWAAGTSSRIENYPGFPDGVGGAALAAGTYQQARRLDR